MKKHYILCLISYILLIPNALGDESSLSEEQKRYTNTLQELASQNNELIESEKLWQETFENRFETHEKILKKLKAIDNSLRDNKSHHSIDEDYAYILTLWRSFVEGSFDNISGKVIERKLPELISYDKFSVELGISEEQIQQIALLHKQLLNNFHNQMIIFDHAQEKDSLQYTTILLYSGKLRSKLFQRLEKTNNQSIQSISNEMLADLWREVQIIPLRWSATFYSKILVFRDNLNAGLMGYFLIAQELLFLCFIGFITFSFIWFFQRVSARFEMIAENNIKKAYRANKHWLWQYFLMLLNKSIPWFLLLLGVKPLESALDKTSIRELSGLLPYIEYYIYYKLIIITTHYTIIKAKMKNFFVMSYTKQAKLLRSFLGIYRYIFINMLLLHTIDTVVGKAIVYSLVIQCFIIFGMIYAIYIVDLWRLEIFYKIHGLLPSSLINLIKLRFRKWYAPLISFVCFNIIFVNYFYNLLTAWLNQFDFSKRVSAKIFLAQIKIAKTQKPKDSLYALPSAYIKQFDCRNIICDLISKKTDFINCKANIDKWLKGEKAVHSMSIYGPCGSGKSALIATLNKQFQDVDFNILSLTNKSTSSDALITHLKKILGGTAQELDLLIEEWRESLKTKRVICIDDAHNLFLAKHNGFEAIKALMKIINAGIDNIFWCITFHRYSWFYIKQVLDSYQCFDSVIKLEPWSADELQTLITSRHKETKYDLSFDDIFFSLEKKNLNDSIDRTKSKFFEILWEQSNGNPSQATRLWLNSLRYNGVRTLYVCLPPLHNTVNFLEMEDEVHFICAAITRHEMLSHQQIQSITGQEDAVVTRVLNLCQKRDLLFQDELQNFRLHKDYASHIIKILKRKNYVY